MQCPTFRSPVPVILLVLALTAWPAAAVTTPDGVTNMTPPAITGIPAFGERLAADPGTWEPAEASYRYQWRRDGHDIHGATHRRYRPRLGDVGRRLAVSVTATNGESAATATSAAVRVVEGTLGSRHRPEVHGARRYDHTLVATAGRWSRKPDTVRYHWLRDGKPIPKSTSRRHHLGLADFGHRISVRVSARARGFRATSATSPRTKLIGHRVPVRHVVTYSVATRGHIVADLGVFKIQAQQTYDDPRGWRGAGVEFRRVAQGGDFTLVLAEASQVPSFSSACTASWSCRVGRYVVINQTRWRSASPMWHQQHRSLRDYRHMVVNHETGHWLGHSHRGCPHGGALAPVMQQQSKSLDGCRPNPWPTLAERRLPRFS